MSTRDDATLSAEERAAFARIEAQAIAEDPSLGASTLLRLEHRLREVVTAISQRTHRSGVGVALLVAGVALVAAGLATTVALSVLGLATVVLGALPVAEVIRQRVERAAAARRPGTVPPEPGA
jgi:multisubunit Na+/H+ antiporter MnhG subunit